EVPLPASAVPTAEAPPPAGAALSRPRAKDAAAAGGHKARPVSPPAGLAPPGEAPAPDLIAPPALPVPPAAPEKAAAAPPSAGRAVTLADVQLVWDRFTAALRQQKKDILVEFMERVGVQPAALQDGVLHLAWAAEPPSFVRRTLEEGVPVLGEVLSRLLRVKISIKFVPGGGLTGGLPGAGGMVPGGAGGGLSRSGPVGTGPSAVSPLEEAGRLFDAEEVGELAEDPFTE
ncbi:MAG: hypothetical protein ACUVTU_12505, partial [Desulfurispora sp.]